MATITHPDLRWKRCDIKSTNLLANVLANQAASLAGCYEAILVDPEGRVTEGSSTSVLWVRGGRLEGTPEGPGLLPGTTRHLVLRLAEAIGIPYADARITLDELIRADEVLLAGTTTEVVSVVQVDAHPIADGTPVPWRVDSRTPTARPSRAGWPPSRTEPGRREAECRTPRSSSTRTRPISIATRCRAPRSASS